MAVEHEDRWCEYLGLVAWLVLLLHEVRVLCWPQVPFDLHHYPSLQSPLQMQILDAPDVHQVQKLWRQGINYCLQAEA